MADEPSDVTLRELEELRARVAALEKECGVEPAADRFRIIFENAPDTMFLHDMAGVFIDGNRAAEELTGYGRHELIGRSFLKLNLLPPAQLPKAAFNMYSKNALGFPTGPDEYTVRRKDGSTVQVEIRSYPVTLDGRPVTLGIARDISARKLSERALAESEERYRNMVELAPGGIITVNRKGFVTSCNESFLKLSGFGRRDIVGRHFTLLPTLIPTDMPGHVRTMAALFKNGGSEAFPFNWKHKDGTRRLGEARVSRLRQNGKVTGLQAFVRDVTDDVRSREFLIALGRAAVNIQSAVDLDAIIEGIHNALVPLDLSYTLFRYDPTEDRMVLIRISYPSSELTTTEKLVGTRAVGSSAGVTGCRLLELLVRDRKCYYHDNLASLIKEFLPLKSEAFARRIVRIYNVPQFLAAPLVYEDKVQGALLLHGSCFHEREVGPFTAFAHLVAAVSFKNTLLQTLRDRLRELEETQAQLLQSQKMEAIGVLAGGVAHDFNNLLTVIIGYSDMALSADEDDPFRQPALEIRNAAEQASALTGQLLAFSRRQPMNPRPVDLNATVLGMQAMLERLLGENVRLVYGMEEGILPVRADPGQVGQVLMNLVINANDALEDDGTITVRTRRTVVDGTYARSRPEAQPGHYAVLEVADTGAGIAAEELPHIFEPFFTTKQPGKGTGLGLSVAYGIIRQHNGWVEVESGTDEGAAFTIFLPLLSGLEERPQDARTGADAGDGSGRILYVEDAASVSGFTVNALRKRGYDVSVHADAEDGLAAFRREPEAFSLVMSDVVLPGMSGFEMVSRIRRERPGIKVLLTSGYTDDKSQWPEIRELEFPFLSKPYGINQLYRALDALDKAPGSE